MKRSKVDKDNIYLIFVSDSTKNNFEDPNQPGDGIVPVEENDEDICMKKRDFWILLIWLEQF